MQKKSSSLKIMALISGLMVLLSLSARADATAESTSNDGPNSESISTHIENPTESRGFAFAGEFLVDTSAPFVSPASAPMSGAYRLSLVESHQPSGLSLAASTSFWHEYSEARDDGSTSGTDDGAAALKKTWKDVAGLDSVFLGVGSVLPLSRESQLAGLQASATLIAGVSQTVRRFELTQNLAYSRRFYRSQDLIEAAAPITPDLYSSKTEIGFHITDKLGLSSAFVLKYLNLGEHSLLYGFNASVDYELVQHMTLSLGLSDIDLPILQDSGVTARPDLYDPNSLGGFVDLVLDI